MFSRFAISDCMSKMTTTPWKLVVVSFVLHAGHMLVFNILLQILHARLVIEYTFVYYLFRGAGRSSFLPLRLSFSIHASGPSVGWRIVSEILVRPLPNDTPTMRQRTTSPSFRLLPVLRPVSMEF